MSDQSNPPLQWTIGPYRTILSRNASSPWPLQILASAKFKIGTDCIAEVYATAFDCLVDYVQTNRLGDFEYTYAWAWLELSKADREELDGRLRVRLAQNKSAIEILDKHKK